MKKDAENIIKAFDLLDTACLNIQDLGRCSDCPMRLYCIDGQYGETTVAELATTMTESNWIEFLTFADTCVPSDELYNDMMENKDYDNYRDKQMEAEWYE